MPLLQQRIIEDMTVRGLAQSPQQVSLRASRGRWTAGRPLSWEVLGTGAGGEHVVIPTRRVGSDRGP
jgi:hypothetical protein